MGELVATITRKIMLMEKECLQCGAPFLGPKQRRYCTRRCWRRAAYLRWLEQHPGETPPRPPKHFVDWQAEAMSIEPVSDD